MPLHLRRIVNSVMPARLDKGRLTLTILRRSISTPQQDHWETCNRQDDESKTCELLQLLTFQL
jgi:hypothetical protein